MKTPVRVALVVPDDRYELSERRHCRFEALRSACEAGDVDLVVFPEDYAEEKRDRVQEVADDCAQQLGVASLVGVGTPDGFQTAVYRNPNPKHEETAAHLYVKHTTSPKVAFDWPDYQGTRAAMFRPIVLNGRKFGVQICHDMYYGLLGHTMMQAKADTFIDLTGGGVNLRKWSNVIQGRSVELSAPFLCTMAKRIGDPASGAACAVAYHSGAVLLPSVRQVSSSGFGGFMIYEISNVPPVARDQDTNGGQEFTAKDYGDITIGVDAPGPVDISITSSPLSVRLGTDKVFPSAGWRGATTRVGRVGVLHLPVEALSRADALYARVPEPGAFDHHIVVYGGRGSKHSVGNVVALARLRAIEHRIAVVVVAGQHRTVLKTNRYKNIQRFADADGRYGLNAEFMGGTWATAGATPLAGIPDQHFRDYLSLAASAHDSPDQEP